MFDEYVEHAVSPPGGGLAHLPELQYQGFEPQAENVEDIPQESLEQLAPEAPIFDLGQVQCTINAPLVSLVVCSDMLVMGLASNMLILIELSHAAQVIQIQIPRKPNLEMTLHKLFMDPSGRHIIITSLQGENWYLYRSWKKPRQLKSFKMVIESVAWNKTALLSTSQPTSTREILIGARNGIVYEAVLNAEEDFFKSQERYLQPVLHLPETQPITGIKYDLFPSSEATKILVVVTTPSRIYQYVGIPDRKSDDAGRVFTGIFASRDPKILELPGTNTYSELHYYTPNADQASSLPKALAWMTGPGIYHGKLNFSSTSDDLIDSADVLPYPPPASEFPISVALTEFHYVLLYKDRLVGVCSLDDKTVYEEPLPLKRDEEVRGITADPVRKTYWVYTDQSIFELLVANEDRDVWKIYLSMKQFDVALQYSKTASQRNKVLSAQANSLFSEARYFQAAQAYSQCSVSFEEVVLKFMDAGERDALRSYLISRLERTRRTDLTQRMMLATWLVEFYLSKCNELDDIVASESVSQDIENVRTERTILEEDLRHFFETYQKNLDPKTTYELIQGHGRTDMYLHYATIIGDSERVIEHWIMEEEWSKAIEVLNRQSDIELYYRFAAVLLRHFTAAAERPRDPLSPDQAVRYLNDVVFEQQNTSTTIHNLLITFYVSPSSSLSSSTVTDDGPLLRFLSSAPSDPLTNKPYYDLDYALRLCKQSGRTQPCVHIYSKMGLYENSVDLALEKGDLELAKINADKPEDDQPLRKKLWLKIARYVVQDKKDIKTAMHFLEDTDLLKIEDILPFFPDFVVIDDFKEEIAHALEGYSSHIDSLKSEMDEATRTAESIQQDIAALRNRFVTIDAGETCSSCSHLLLTRQFYVFPCRHNFHADCLIGLAKEYLPAHSLRRILALQTELMKGSSNAPTVGNITSPSQAVGQGRQPQSQRTLLSSNFTSLANPLHNGTRAANLLGRNILSAGDRLRDLIIPDALAAVVSTPTWIPGIGGGGRRSGAESDDGQKVEKLKAELDEVLAGSCPLCESVVVGLDKPFVREGEADTTWAL
ncbi:tethering complex subunit [Marasmius tenuissimus]|nr:tethering complex subunit [Marasmius tenuissimus]